MLPIFMGYHGPKPGTIWYTIQAILMAGGFGGGAVFITYEAIILGSPGCLLGAVFCAIFCILFIIGYIIDTRNFRDEAKKKAEKSTPMGPPAQPKGRSVLAKAPIMTPSEQEPQVPASTTDELIK